jgi:hypothetical protein
MSWSISAPFEVRPVERPSEPSGTRAEERPAQSGAGQASPPTRPAAERPARAEATGR